ncbi:hypothetical protein NP493_1548g00066 [Ridgeia piscesae]|uniref:Uncharacterized protein n=1 Tax=Ridgeia piscesae TaxID=27915 RepID=A0AAD9JZ97_RIDPI|nr:hypothetical protein NP493_1548g00066 [Ridgeia piscesae]
MNRYMELSNFQHPADKHVCLYTHDTSSINFHWAIHSVLCHITYPHAISTHLESLYSAVFSPQDYSKHFTHYSMVHSNASSTMLGSIQSFCNHCTKNTCTCIQLYNRVNWCNVE